MALSVNTRSVLPANPTGSINPMSDLTLRERTGEGRELRLMYEALPFRPMAFPCRQRIKRELYGGNPDATQQLFGPDFGPLKLRGKWSDRWLGARDIAVLTGGATGRRVLSKAWALRDVVRDLWLAGQELDFVWHKEAYRGHIESFTPSPLRIQDIEWEMTFSVTGFGLTEAKAQYVEEFDFTGDATDLLAVASQWLGEVQGQMRKAKAFTGRIGAYMDRADLLRRQLELTILQATDLALTPVTLASRLAQSVQDMSQLMMVVARVASKVDAATEAAGSDWTSMQDVYAARAAVFQASLKASAQSRSAGASALRKLSPKVVRVVTATEGMTWQRIAIDTWGDQSGWEQIQAYNNSTDPLPTAGLSILVPERQPVVSTSLV